MATATRQTVHVKVADETWLVTALLHRENPKRKDFTILEIVQRAGKERIAGELRPGVRVHALLHCVANLRPNPGRYRMLFATGKLTRRLFRPGDPYHPDRENSKTVPAKEDIPTEYHGLIDWFYREHVPKGPSSGEKDSILALRGLGKEIWKGVDPDEYVRQLREGWE
jgi:hypothetical protein